MDAYDSGSPDKVAQFPLTVNVIRNQNSPQFVAGPYTGSVNSDTPRGSVIVNVTALDGDKVNMFIINLDIYYAMYV